MALAIEMKRQKDEKKFQKKKKKKREEGWKIPVTISFACMC